MENECKSLTDKLGDVKVGDEVRVEVKDGYFEHDDLSLSFADYCWKSRLSRENVTYPLLGFVSIVNLSNDNLSINPIKKDFGCMNIKLNNSEIVDIKKIKYE